MSLIPISEKVTSLFVLPYFFTEECSYAMLCYAMLELVELYLVIFQYYYLDGMGADINAMMGGQGPTSDSGFFLVVIAKFNLKNILF